MFRKALMQKNSEERNLEVLLNKKIIFMKKK